MSVFVARNRPVSQNPIWTIHMLKTLQQASKEELRTLVDFARLMVVKEQEVADAAEEIALKRAGALYTPTETLTRDWEQIVGYAAPGAATVETRSSPLWLRRLADAPALRHWSNQVDQLLAVGLP